MKRCFLKLILVVGDFNAKSVLRDFLRTDHKGEVLEWRGLILNEINAHLDAVSMILHGPSFGRVDNRRVEDDDGAIDTFGLSTLRWSSTPPGNKPVAVRSEIPGHVDKF